MSEEGAGRSAKERFAPEDWHQLKLLPILVFEFTFLRLARDRPQDVDPDQPRTFFRSLLDYKPLEPTFRELIVDISDSEWPALVEEGSRSDVLGVLDSLEAIRGSLSGALSRREYNTFLTAVISVGMQPFQALPVEAKDVWMNSFRDLVKIFDVDLESAIRSLQRAQQQPAG